MSQQLGSLEANTAAVLALTVEIISLKELLAANGIQLGNTKSTSGDKETGGKSSDSTGKSDEKSGERETAAQKKAREAKEAKAAAAKNKPKHTVAEAQAVAREVAKHENGGSAVARGVLDSIEFTGKLSELSEDYADAAFAAFTAKLKELDTPAEEEGADDF